MNGNRSNAPAFPGRERLLAWFCWNASTVAVTISATIVLKLVGLQVTRTDQGIAVAESPGSVLVTGTEVTDIWLPKTFCQVARSQAEALNVQSEKALQSYWKQHARATLWYALTLRVRQLNGRMSELTFIKRVNQAPQDFQEFLDLLGAARGKFRQRPAADFSRVRINTIPEELLEWEPRAVRPSLRRSIGLELPGTRTIDQAGEPI